MRAGIAQVISLQTLSMELDVLRDITDADLRGDVDAALGGLL